MPSPNDHSAVPSDSVEIEANSAISTAAMVLDSWDETSNADRLAKLYGNDLCYCIERRGFYVWDGHRWVWDDFRMVEGMAESTMRYALIQAGKIRDPKARKPVIAAIKKATNRNPLCNMIHLVKKKVRGRSISEFDASPTLLNCANGVIDTVTGKLLPYDREYLCSKMVPIDYDPKAECPRFMAFLMRAMGGGPAATPDQQARARELVDCLQRLFGCCATGVFAKILVLFFGTRDGNNGKTTLLETIRDALGGDQYAGEVQINTLMARNSESGSNNSVFADIADLKGCRLVTCSEPEEGHRLSVSRAKYLTGGNQIKGRYMRENPFTFRPSHKIIMDLNHPPIIENSNDAVWNRVKCIPFSVNIPPGEIDQNLPAKLREELPGILTWIIQGAVIYNELGLEFPPAVDIVTEEYRTKSDHFPFFQEDVCVSGVELWTPVTKVKEAYETWAAFNGEETMPPKTFGERMLAAGYKSTREWDTAFKPRRQVRAWKGIGLKRGPRMPVSFRPSDAR